MRLWELLNQSTEWSWRTKSPREWGANFSTDDNTYWVYLDGHDGGEVSIVFSDDERSEEITGRGNSFKVFATVANIVRDFMRQRHPSMLSFTANEPSRIKLYKRLADNLAHELHGRVSTVNMGGTRKFRVILDQDDEEAYESLHEDGKIIPNVNTTCDVQPGETERQAIKFGNKLDAKSRPPLLRGSYGDDSAQFSANQGDPFYGSDGTKLTDGRK